MNWTIERERLKNIRRFSEIVYAQEGIVIKAVDKYKIRKVRTFRSEGHGKKEYTA